MSEAFIIVLISSMGGTMLTVAGAIIQQTLAAKSAKGHAEKQNAAHEEIKTNTDEFRLENKDAMYDLKAMLQHQQDMLDRQQSMLDRQTHINKVILRDKLRYLLKQQQDKTSVSFADKEDIDTMYQIYADDGHNGTIKKMYEEFMKKKVV